MYQDPAAAVRAIATFLDIPITEEVLAAVVKNSSISPLSVVLYMMTGDPVASLYLSEALFILFQIVAQVGFNVSQVLHADGQPQI
jgi:hypothetical protein